MFDCSMKQFTLLVFLLFSTQSFSQEIFVDTITIVGNKRTKKKVILRELTFSPNESIMLEEDLEAFELYNRNRILSLGLFNEVEIEFIETQANYYNVKITVNENWYLFPSIIFELADRNFNLWWYELDRDLTRVNYGVRGDHANLTGHKDKLSLTAQLGYTRKLELKYNLPFLEKSGNWSSSFNAFYADVKEISYATIGNKTQFASFNEEIMLTRFRLGGDIGYRKNLFARHGFRLEYHKNRINKYAAEELNPNYFLNGDTENRFFFFNYTYFYDTKEFRIYPEAGYFFHLNIKKEGLYIFNDFNNLSVAAEFEQYFNYQKKLLWHYRVKAKTNLIRNKVAFAYNSALGWSKDLIRGYEIYAIDGSDFAYAKTEVHYKYFENTYDLSNFLPISQFNKIDVKLYLSLGLDAGYVNERHYIETNTFTNRLLYGYGPTLSLMLYNSHLFQIDYSINHLGERGIYFDSKISF